MSMLLPFTSLIVPTNLPVKTLNPLIVDLFATLFDTSSVLLSVPKFAGAAATPQGWSSGHPCATRRTNAPASVYRSTYPPDLPDWLAKVTNSNPPISWIPNGAKPAGTVESVNEPVQWKLASYISTLLFALSAANSTFPDVLAVDASPV